MRRLLALLSSTIVIVFGLITLLGLLVGRDLGFLSTLVGAFHVRDLTNLFLRLVMVTAAITIFIGLLNLFAVHLGRTFRRGQRGGFYSFITVISAALVIGLTIAERMQLIKTPAGQLAPTTLLLETVAVSVEAALAALVLFALVYGAYRLMRRRVTWAGVIFTLALLIALLGALPLPGRGISLIAEVRAWMLAVPVSAGARGILLGIALATVVTGVRLLTGQDRSYRD